MYFTDQVEGKKNWPYVEDEPYSLIVKLGFFHVKRGMYVDLGLVKGFQFPQKRSIKPKTLEAFLHSKVEPNRFSLDLLETSG